MRQADIVIAGGGLTAQILAIILRHSGYAITLLSGDMITSKPDHRTQTIHARARLLFQALGLWSELATKSWSITDIKTSAGDATKQKKWPLHWHSQTPPMAYILPNHHLETVFANHLSDFEILPMTVQDVKFDDKVYFHDSAGCGWSCDLLIACDGSQSTLRDKAGLYALNQGRAAAALVAHIKTENPIDHLAFQRFLPAGPLAVMATNTHEASLIWSMPESSARHSMTLEIADFNQRLTTAFGDDLGTLSLSSPLLCWPLRPYYMPKITRSNFVLAGDAAHALHPLAGMGFNLALSDGAVLLDILQTAYRTGLKAGHISITNNYATRRQTEILAMTTVTQTLDRLFSAPALAPFGARGMAILGHSRLRNILRDLAMGGKLSPAPLFDGQIKSE